jgi:hypothetical protein
MRIQWIPFWLASIAVCTVNAASAQMVTTQMPLQHTGTSFYEQSNIGWSIHNPHYFMTFGGGVAPPFGGYQPNAGLQSGFAVGNAHLNFGFAQGASVSNTMYSPMLTTTSGYPGYVFDGVSRPLVTGVTPLVGGGFGSVPAMSPIEARVATGQLKLDHGRIVVPERDPIDIPPAPAENLNPRRLPALPVADKAPAAANESPRDITAAQYLARGIEAEKSGKPGVAKVYFQLAMTKGDALIRADASTHLDALKSASSK